MITLGLAIGLSVFQEVWVTATIPAMPASKALEKLGSQYHLTLTTSPQTADDVLVFRFNKVGISEVFKKIAEADDATWKKEDEFSYRLIRTSDQQRALREKAFNLSVQQISRALQKKRDEIKAAPAWNAQAAEALAAKVATHLKSFNPQSQGGDWYQRASQLSNQAPIGKMVNGIVASMDPRELAGLPAGTKVVWSTNPTPMQRPMPREATALIEQYIREEGDWAAAVDKWQLKAPTVGNTTYWVGGFGDFQGIGNIKIATVILTTMPALHNSYLSFELSSYDEKGKRISQTNVGLADQYGIYNDLMKPVELKPGEKVLTLEGDAKQVGDVILSMRKGTVAGLPTDLTARIADTVNNEPLNLMVGPLLIQSAEIRNVNLAAHLSDDQVMTGMVVSMAKMGVDRYLSALGTLGTEISIKDGWLSVKPSNPVPSPEEQVDRRELGKFLARSTNARSLSVDEQAYFALKLPDPQVNQLPQMFQQLVRPKRDPTYYNRDLLRFYGLLTSSQKSQMQNGGLACGSLTREEAGYLGRMVFGQNGFLQYQPRPGKDGRIDDGNWDLYYNGIMREQTVALPNGLPPQALIKLDVDNSSIVMSGQKDNARFFQPGQEMDPNTLAWNKYGQEHPEIFPWMADEVSRTDLTRLTYGKRLKLTFTVHFTPELSLIQTLDDKSATDFQPVTLDTLPDDFKQKFLAAYNDYVKNYANAKPGQFNSANRNTNIPPR